MAAFVASERAVSDYSRLFVNRRAFTMQSLSRDPESGRCNYFRPQGNVPLSAAVLRRHLEGEITIALYAINPLTQRCKWMAIDADYPEALRDLLKLQWALQQEGVEAALEKSRRGGHLWIFAQQPLLARACRKYIHGLAARLNVPIRGAIRDSNSKDVAVCAEGIEVFPRQDRLSSTGYGNALRAPLGIHRGSGRRYWFYGADYQLEAQIEYLNRLKKVSEEELSGFLSAEVTREDSRQVTLPANQQHGYSRRIIGPQFSILEHLGEKGRRVGRNYVTRCPACASHGKDRHGDNLAVSIADPRKYKCWAGCTKEEIRRALGCPIPMFRSFAERTGAKAKNIGL